MTDFNAILTPGELPDYVNTVIEIPKGSMLKVEYRRELGIFELDRVEPVIFAKPASYGFIPQTLDDDGDELDTLVITDEPLPTGLVVRAKVIGILNFEDDGEMDHKIICVPLDERNTGNAIRTLDDLPKQWQSQVEHHFNHYKDLKKPGTTKVLGWGDVDAANIEINKAIKSYQESK